MTQRWGACVPSCSCGELEGEDEVEGVGEASMVSKRLMNGSVLVLSFRTECMIYRRSY